MLSTAIPIVIAAIVMVIISRGMDKKPIIPNIYDDAKMFGIIAKKLNFIDLNKDNNLSYEEINRSIKLFFQLIDENKDSNISELEIIKLKEIIDSIQ